MTVPCCDPIWKNLAKRDNYKELGYKKIAGSYVLVSSTRCVTKDGQEFTAYTTHYSSADKPHYDVTEPIEVNISVEEYKRLSKNR